MMEIPTTTNVPLLKEFQCLLQEIRPVAEAELNSMSSNHRSEYDEMRSRLVPASLIMDIALYLSCALSEESADTIMSVQVSGDMEKFWDHCERTEQYWMCNRALVLALRVFAQDPATGVDYVDYSDEPEECYVCGCVPPKPLTASDRKSCYGGCPMCMETIEAVFNK